MAAREHRVSRRALLGAAILSLVEGSALPELVEGRALPRRPELDSGSTSSFEAPAGRWIPDQVRNDEQWRRALARFRHADAVLKAHAHDPDEDRYDAVNAVFHNALRRLMQAPAPNLPALSLKIDLAVDQEVAELTDGEACLAALKGDARRLCSAHPEWR